MKIHKLKTDQGPFEALLSGRKTFEVRKNDRNFQVGDELWLFEHDPKAKIPATGRYVHKTIEYMLSGPQYGIPDNYAILGIVDVQKRVEVLVAEHPQDVEDWIGENAEKGVRYVWVVEGEETDKLIGLQVNKIRIL